MPPTRLQLEGPSLEELLGRVQREHGARARILQAEKVRTGGVGGFFAREVYRIEVEVEQPAAAPVTGPLSLLDLAEAVSDEEEAVASPGALPAPRPPLRRPALSTESPTFAAVLAGLAADAADGEDDFVPLPRRKPAARRSAAANPAAEVPPVVPADGPVQPPAVLRALPTPEPVGAAPAYAPGQVVAIAGELQLALRAVHAVARELGVDRPDVYVAATDPSRLRDVRPARRLVDPARVAPLRARWGRREEATFVVVDAPLLLRPEGWARSMLGALGAGVTWGAVSATTKAADVDRWAERLGGLDLLAVHDLEATVDPTELLSGRWQVGLVDGCRPAATAPVRRTGRGRGVA
jgi:hypothetical protein